MFTNWILLYQLDLYVHLSHHYLFLQNVLSNDIFCWNIFFSSVPLEYLYRTCFYTCTICNTRIPINCNHSSTNTKRNLFLHLLQYRLLQRRYLQILQLVNRQCLFFYLDPTLCGNFHHLD